MDASDRSGHVYGKTESGKSALHQARNTLSSAARQLLILINGQRTLGELWGILGAETVERALEQLEVQGYVEVLRHFPDAEFALTQLLDPLALDIPIPVPVQKPRAAPHHRSVLPFVVLGLVVAAIGAGCLLLLKALVSTGPNLAAEPAPPRVAAEAGQA